MTEQIKQSIIAASFMGTIYIATLFFSRGNLVAAVIVTVILSVFWYGFSAALSNKKENEDADQ